MNPELTSQLDAIKTNKNRNPVEEMIFLAVQKFEANGGMTEYEQGQLKTIFLQYHLLNATQSKEIQEWLIHYLTTLGIQELESEVGWHVNNWEIVSLKTSWEEPWSKTIALSEEKVLEWFSDLEALPRYNTYKEFLASDFFAGQYSLWNETIRFQRDNYDYRRLSLTWEESIAKLQTILIFLWYMTEEDLLGRYVVSEAQYETISFFGIWWPKTFASVRTFQKSLWLEDDGIIGMKTKEKLYREIYHIFHKKDQKFIANTQGAR